jgi:hypothetical protein
VQVTFSRAVLQRFGLGVSAATPAIALFTGGLGALVFPGLSSAIAARGGESVFRGSLFRASYEIFYTPIPRREKRAAKSLVDVAFDRLGDAVGGGLLRLSLLLAPQSRITTILALAIGTATIAIFVATRLNRGYVLTLERSLLNRAAELDVEELDDPMTQTMMLQTSSIRLPPIRRVTSTADATAAGTRSQTTEGSQDLDHDLSLIRALRSRNREVITEALHSSDALPSTTIQDVIPLLAWDAVAEDVGIALRRIAEDHVGQLIDTLLDQNQDFAVRRRLARVFTVCVSQRAVDGLMLGLEDRRFEVRFQCARSLVSIAEKNPRVRVDRDVIFEMVRRETTVGRPVWESHRLLNLLEDRDEHVFVDEFVKERPAAWPCVHAAVAVALPPIRCGSRSAASIRSIHRS